MVGGKGTQENEERQTEKLIKPGWRLYADQNHEVTLNYTSHRPVENVIVMGGSAGAISALQEVVHGFPSDMNAAVLVVVHLPPRINSALPKILSRAGPLSAVQPQDSEELQNRQIYVAPPDCHLTVARGVVHVRKGPRENGHRPAIDPLFRTAARIYGSCVVGVILSGYQEDGAAGLYAVRARGGVVVVQDPADAEAAHLPERALQYGAPHYVLPAREIGARVAELSKCAGGAMSESDQTGKPENDRANEEVKYPEEGAGQPSVFACPECHGVLWELNDGDLVRFRCRVGHSYSPGSLQEDLSENAESSLWAAMRALEEKAAMNRRLADTVFAFGSERERLRDQAAADMEHADRIREMIFKSE